MSRMIWIAIVAALGILAAGAEEPSYIGASKCKMCHKVEYTSWEATAHAKALDPLEPADAAKPECLKCHATGGSAEFPGVQCEACHGPGSGYKSMKVMKDREAALAAGLVLPDEATCRACHEGAPHDQPAFDYATASKTGVHEFKPKE